MAKKQTNVIPTIEDARHPAKYMMLVAMVMVDVIFSNFAQPNQILHANNASEANARGGPTSKAEEGSGEDEDEDSKEEDRSEEEDEPDQVLSKLFQLKTLPASVVQAVSILNPLQMFLTLEDQDLLPGSDLQSLQRLDPQTSTLFF